MYVCPCISVQAACESINGNVFMLPAFEERSMLPCISLVPDPFV